MCKHELYAFQNIMDFTLLFPDNKFNLDLMELLEYNFHLRILISELNVQIIIKNGLIPK